MSKKNLVDNFNNKNIDIDNISKKIFDSIYDPAHYVDSCIKCGSNKLEIMSEENKVYKCKDCNHSFSPKVNSLYSKLRLNEEKLYEFIKGMINDLTLEDLAKKLMLSSDSINKKWELLYNEVDWERFNLSIREKPSKNIYANFEVIIG